MGIAAAVPRGLRGLFATAVTAGLLCAVAPGTAAARGADRQTPPDRTGVHVHLGRGAPALPSHLSALSWAVSDATTGDVLATHDAHRALPPASTLKTLFAVTVLPKFRQDSVRKVSDADLAGIGDGSSMVGVQAGNRYSVADLWRGVFLRSGNDAVHVLAAMNGGWSATAREMQAKARELGARDTHVKSPDGYDQPGQVSSAFDLSIFARAGLGDPDFARYCATATARFPGRKPGESFPIENTNRLLTGSHGLTRYDGVIGVKNGYTTHAGNTVVVAARKHGRTLLATVMNPRSGEANAVYREAGSLLDWGFAAVGRVRPVGSLGSASAPHPRTAPAGPATAAPAASRTRADDGPSPATAAAWIGGSAAVLVAAAAVAWRRLHARHRGTTGTHGARSASPTARWVSEERAEADAVGRVRAEADAVGGEDRTH